MRAAESGHGTQANASSSNGSDDRALWCQLSVRLATPLLEALAMRQLRQRMPVESAPGITDRPDYTYLEGFSRLLCGIAPWLELGGDDSPEGQQRAHLAELARNGIDAGTDPGSPDFMNFSRGKQPLVDAAFLAQAMLRAPNELWRKLDPRVQQNVVAALKSSRGIAAYENNWKLFAAEIEAFLQQIGQDCDRARLFEALTKFKRWYLGDSIYGDGPQFHWDYYNAFVIHPMLVETLDVVGNETPEWRTMRDEARVRLTRFASIQERLIAPDGTYPVIGRSIAYRCGAFQGLALAALRKTLGADLKPAQVRVALSSVIRRTLESTDAWNDDGWLRIGLSGHQPSLGERYISTGSLYLCSTAFLPLGLPSADPFWSAEPEKTTWQRVWAGEDLPADHAIDG
ncbi:MAG: DUF2264 domain-containing protein [Opitutus sp.]